MAIFVALLRAVNVGGTGKLPMADLRALLEGLGYTGVRTYIQSGNAVFEAGASGGKRVHGAGGEEDRAEVARRIRAALAERMGGDPGVVLRTHEELGRVIQRNPFAGEAAEDGARVHVAFLEAPAGEGTAAVLRGIAEKYPARRDRFHVDGDVVYFHFPDGAGETKFTGKALERAMGRGTGRNWNTVVKLYAMSAG